MAASVFEFLDYKEFLGAALPTRGEGRGERSRLAHALGVQPAFVSQVLRGGAEFSLEQGSRIVDFLALTPEETNFFLLLLQRARAGSKALKSFFEKQIEEILQKRALVSERVRPNRNLDASERARFFGRWYHGALHVALHIPTLRTPEALAQHFGLSRTLVLEALQFLEQIGLVEQNGPTYHPTANRIHLPSSSFEIIGHHTEWRLQALRLLERKGPLTLNYSGAIALSRANAEQARKILLSAIEQLEPLLAAPGEESVYLLNLDFMEI